MLITNHVLAGAAIGALSKSKRTAFATGLLSHALMDALPHWGARDRKHFLTVAVIDGLIGAAAATAIAVVAGREKRSRVVAGMFGATLPDANKPCREFFGSSPFPGWVDRGHGAIRCESPERMDQEILLAGLGTMVVASILRDHVHVDTRRQRQAAERTAR